jgi:hypothetical protein
MPLPFALLAQIVPLAQRRALEQLSEFSKSHGLSLLKEMTAIVANPLRRLVELVGIEPTTSSLRTMRSPS